MEKIRVLIAEEQSPVRETVRRLLGTESDIEVVGEAASLSEMMVRVSQSPPDVVLLNVTVSESAQPGILRKIKALYPGIKIMAVTMSNDCEYFFEVPLTGISDCPVKTGSPEEFVMALRDMMDKNQEPASTMARDVLQKYALKAKARLGDSIRLTKRQRQILSLTADGCSNSEIASQLSLKPSTVRTHRACIMTKLGLPNHTDLLKYVMANGFVSLGTK